jgi:hypothetical protein
MDAMGGSVQLFVSATPDLEPEREVVGQVVAALPVSIGWQIGRSPRRGEPLQPALEVVAGCDLYLFLLGRDIAAPAGVEWDVACRVGKKPLAFVLDVLHTPAAQAFLRQSGREWTAFASQDKLADLLRTALVEHLLAGALRYGLNVVEHEALSALSEDGGAGDEAGASIEVLQAEGAGGGGVILGPHSLPPGGVLVGSRD